MTRCAHADLRWKPAVSLWVSERERGVADLQRCSSCSLLQFIFNDLLPPHTAPTPPDLFCNKSNFSNKNDYTANRSSIVATVSLKIILFFNKKGALKFFAFFLSLSLIFLFMQPCADLASSVTPWPVCPPPSPTSRLTPPLPSCSCPSCFSSFWCFF